MPSIVAKIRSKVVEKNYRLTKKSEMIFTEKYVKLLKSICWWASCLSLVLKYNAKCETWLNSHMLAPDTVLCTYTLLTWANQLLLIYTLFMVSAIHFSSYSQNLLVGWFFRNVVVWTSLSTCPKSSGIECELLLQLMTWWYCAPPDATFCQTTQTFWQLTPSANLNFLPT